MKVTSKEEAFDIIENQKSSIPFEAIKYLRNYGKDDEILKKVIEGLERFREYSNVPLWYGIVAEGHLDPALVDPVIGLFTSDIDAGDFMHEQGGYLIEKLLKEIGDEVVEKCLAEIFRLYETESEASYHFLFFSLMFVDLDKYDAQISKMLEKKDAPWAFALYGDLAHPRFERYLPKLKELLRFYKKNKDKSRMYNTCIIEIEAAITDIELGDNFVEKEGKLFSDYRSDWEEHYKQFEKVITSIEYESVFDDLWWRLENDDIKNFADEAIQAFNREIYPEEIEEQNLGAFIDDLTYELEFARMYDKIEELHGVLKKHNLDLYIREGECVENALFKYYCFKGEGEKFLELVGQGFEILYAEEAVLNKLVYYACNGFGEQVDRFIEKEYHSIAETSEIDDFLVIELSLMKFFIELEKLYLSEDDKIDIGIEELGRKIEPYYLDTDSIFNDSVELGIKDSSLEKIEALLSSFPEDKEGLIVVLQFRFFVKMFDVGCPFLVAGFIWRRLLAYFYSHNDNSKNWHSFFRLKEDFEDFIINIINDYAIVAIEGPLLIWGADYFLEFLLDYNIINEKRYHAQRKMLNGVKKRCMLVYPYDLWMFNFIHKWKAPKGIDLDAWKAEEKKFVASFDIQPERKINENRVSELLEMLKNHPELSRSKLGARLLPKSEGRVFVGGEKKIGRNEKVSVKYSDGRVINDVKYKKVEKDLENGKCELL